MCLSLVQVPLMEKKLAISFEVGSGEMKTIEKKNNLKVLNANTCSLPTLTFVFYVP